MDGEICREQILSQEYWDFILPDYADMQDWGVAEDEICIQDIDYGYRSIYVSSAGQRYPLSIERYWYNAIPGCYGLLDMAAMNEAGITAVQNYPGLELMGEGVMIGFLDTGIDYTNPIFQKMDGSTRIVGLWDQTIQNGALPEGFSYGSEYTQKEINEALQSEAPFDTVPSRDTNGHGTFLASIAAGNANSENRFLGAAPESSLVVVKLKEAKEYLKEFYGIKKDAVCYQENDMLLALRYLSLQAQKRRMPLVVCIALGTNFGGHNNATLLSEVLNMYSHVYNRCIVIGGGNEANQRHHYMGTLIPPKEEKMVELRVESRVESFVAEVWAMLPNVITISLQSPSGERTPFISIRQGSRYTYSFTFEQTEVSVEYRLLVQNNNSQLIFLRFRNPSQGIWKIIVSPVKLLDGEFHIWLPMQEFLSGDIYFLEAVPDTTITEPSSTENGITVAYYNGADKSIDINSGRGYTRSRTIKPELAAPGVGVTGAGLNGSFVTRTGSSVAAGIAAGAAALLFEWMLKQGGSGASASQIRSLLILGADQRPLLEYPNREWGYGTLDLYETLDEIRRL